MFKKVILHLLAVVFYCSCSAQDKKVRDNTEVKVMENTNQTVDTAIFGSVCFWGTEYYFKKLKDEKFGFFFYSQTFDIYDGKKPLCFITQ